MVEADLEAGAALHEQARMRTFSLAGLDTSNVPASSSGGQAASPWPYEGLAPGLCNEPAA